MPFLYLLSAESSPFLDPKTSTVLLISLCALGKLIESACRLTDKSAGSSNASCTKPGLSKNEGELNFFARLANVALSLLSHLSPVHTSVKCLCNAE